MAAGVALIAGYVAVAAIGRRVLVSRHRRCSLVRQVAAGVLGLAAGIAAGQAVAALGVDADAVSHHPTTPWALVEEAVSMTAFYGSMLGVAFVVLRPEDTAPVFPPSLEEGSS